MTKTVSELARPHFIGVTSLTHLSAEQLDDRIAWYAAKGKDVAARIANGERGEVVGSAVRGGQHVDVHALEHSLNSLRHGYACAVMARRQK